MNAKQWFKLTAKMVDRQKQYFKTKDKNVLQQSKDLEAKAMEEIIRVAMLDKEIHDFIMNDCPFFANILKSKI